MLFAERHVFDDPGYPRLHFVEPGKPVQNAHVESFNASVCPERLTDVAKCMGVEVQGLSAEQGAQAAIAAIRALSKDVGIPAGLKDLGAKADDIPVLAANALKDACGLTNPRPADQQQIEEIFRNAF